MTEYLDPSALYAKLDVKTDLVPLALTVPNEFPVQIQSARLLGWTSESMDALRKLDGALRDRDKQLPHRALLTHLDLHVRGIWRQRVGAAHWDRPGPYSGRFAWIDGEASGVEQNVARALQRWIVDDLPRVAKSDQAALDALERVRELFFSGRLLTMKMEDQLLYPWQQAPNGTPVPTGEGYANLADFVARALEGCVVFEGLSPLRRIVSRYSRFSNYEAELMTDPTDINGREQFSLVLKIRVISLPGVSQPAIRLDASRRRWVRRMKPEPFGSTSISGYAFPKQGSIAVRFMLETKNKAYVLGEEYHVLERHYRLKGDLDGVAIAQGKANNKNCELYVNFRHGYGDHELESGVSERDRLEAFENALEILAPLGFQARNPPKKIPTRNKVADDRGLVDVKVLKEKLGLLEEDEQRPNDKKRNDAKRIVARSRDALRRYHPEKPRLLVVHHETCRADAELVRDAVRVLTDGDLEVEIARVPSGAHGPKDDLPLAREKAAERAQARMEAWRPFAERLREIAQEANVVGCLVVAPMFYDSGRDDLVNKQAGKKIIASVARVPVQYLLPRERNLNDFLMRAQSAWRDLVWAHLGRVDDVAGKVGRVFPGGEAPGEILGISVIQSNKKRGGRQGSLFPVAFRLDVDDGLCYMRFAYEESPGKLDITEWEPIQRALCHISDLTPQKIGEETEVRRQHFEKFCKQVITDSCNAGRHPLVLINSTNSARLWSWLSDRAIDSANIDFKTEGTAMQAAWSSARIVRVRQENSPRLVIDKQQPVAQLDKSDKRSREEIQPEASLRVTTSHQGNGALYKVADSEFPVYLTIGGKDIDRHKKGTSCYRKVALLGNKVRKTEGKLNLYPLEIRDPSTNQWSAAKAIELLLAFIQEEDKPDAVAELVESLRFGYGHYGEWTSLPAPLFFERVVRDYVAEFQDEEETEEETEE